MKLTLRTKTIGARVTDDEYVRLEAHAESQGQKVSEWARAVLVREACGEVAATSGEQTTLAEVLALRTILLNLLFRVASGERMTAEEMKQLIERADHDKTSKAQQRLGRA
jgi:hypothetical protein